MIGLTLIILGTSSPDWEISAIGIFQNQEYDLKQVIKFNSSDLVKNPVSGLPCVSPILQRYCTIINQPFVNRQDACSTRKFISCETRILPVADNGAISLILETINTEFTAILPANIQLNFLPPQLTNTALAFLTPKVELPLETAKQYPVNSLGWIASTPSIKAALPQLEIKHWNLLAVARELERQNIAFTWGTAKANTAYKKARQFNPSRKASYLAIYGNQQLYLLHF